jgi:hypothetical protein
MNYFHTTYGKYFFGDLFELINLFKLLKPGNNAALN